MAMRFADPSGNFRPFEDLEKLLERKSITTVLPPVAPNSTHQGRTRHPHSKQTTGKQEKGSSSKLTNRIEPTPNGGFERHWEESS